MMQKFKDNLDILLFDFHWLVKDHEKEIIEIEKENKELKEQIVYLKNIIKVGNSNDKKRRNEII